MRHLLFLLVFLPTLASAETFAIDTKVTEVTLYPHSATVIRSGDFDVPAGDHRLVLLGIPASGTRFETLRVHADNVQKNALVRRTDNVPSHDYKREGVRQAEERVKEIERRIEAVKDDAQATRLKAAAANQTIAFLGKLGDNEGLAEAGTETLRQIAQMIGQEALTAGQTAQAAEIEAKQVERQLEDLHETLRAAQADLDALALENQERAFVAVDILAENPAKGAVSVTYLVTGETQWMPVYEFHLTTGDAPEVTIARSALLQQDTGENWQDITLRLSTLQPTGQNEASALFPLRRRISDPEEKRRSSVATFDRSEAVLEAPVVVEESQAALPVTSSVDGTGVTYTLPRKVSIASGGEFAEISIGALTQAVEMFALAVPMQDKTAFRTVRFENGSGQTLLGSDLSEWYVDGSLVAAGYAPMIRQGEEVEMGFGPIYGLSVDRDILNRSSGDTGIITRSNQRVEQVEIRIENLTGQIWPLRLIDRVPFSEQDDLQIDWSASPQPDQENVDKQRGILAWEMELPSDQAETIRLDTTLGWPEGMELR